MKVPLPLSDRIIAPVPSLTLIAALSLALVLSGCGRHNARDRPQTSLSEPDRTMLQEYEAIRVSLAQDDFRAAKRQAADYGKELGAVPASSPKPPGLNYIDSIASAVGLDAQREAFRGWSKLAIERSNGVEGFYVIHCPLPGCGDWVQRDSNVDNPFMGKAMHDCGVVQK